MDELRTPQAAVAASATPALLETVSWGAVLAGAVIGLAILTVLNLFGLAIGLYVIDAADPNLGAEAAGSTAGVWWALSALVALFVGGWVAGKLTGNPNDLIAGIHGAAVWAAATLLAVAAVSSAASAAFTGAAGLVGQAAQVGGRATGATVSALDPAIDLAADSLAQELQQGGVSVDAAELRQEVRVVLDRAISPAERQRLENLAQGAATAAIKAPNAARSELQQFLTGR